MVPRTLPEPLMNQIRYNVPLFPSSGRAKEPQRVQKGRQRGPFGAPLGALGHQKGHKVGQEGVKSSTGRDFGTILGDCGATPLKIHRFIIKTPQICSTIGCTRTGGPSSKLTGFPPSSDSSLPGMPFGPPFGRSATLRSSNHRLASSLYGVYLYQQGPESSEALCSVEQKKHGRFAFPGQGGEDKTQARQVQGMGSHRCY